jgi:hypothetical protein
MCGKARKLAKKLIAQRLEFYGTNLTTLADILATHPDPKMRDSGTDPIRSRSLHGFEQISVSNSWSPDSRSLLITVADIISQSDGILQTNVYRMDLACVFTPPAEARTPRYRSETAEASGNI